MHIRDTVADFQGEAIRDEKEREVVRFTTPSGVRAAFATDISDDALKKFALSLRRKLARSQARLATKPTGSQSSK